MFDFNLRALAERSGPERAFLSVYLSSPDSVGQLQQRIKHARAFLADQPIELEHFEESLKLAEPHFEGAFTETSRVVFASWAADYVQVFDLPLALPDLVRVDSSPYIRPLAELEDEYEDFAVVVVDNRAAQIYRVDAADIQKAGRVRGDVKNRVKKGGWSQQRYARRREKELERYATEVAGTLTELHRERPFERLVLLGQDEAMRALEAALPTDMRQRLVGEQAINVGEGEAAVERAALALYFEEERASEDRLWEEIREGYLSGGLAVTGATRVLEAARQGRVEVALVDREAKIEGSRCRDCEHLAHGLPQTCYACGSEDLFAVDLVNELVELLAQTSAEADFTDPSDALTEVGHVAALLRY
jgi:peptide subunit release factor 1 (eRF1)